MMLEFIRRRGGNMKANLNQVFTRKKNGRLRPTWRYLLGRLLGSLEGKERGGEETNDE